MRNRMPRRGAAAVAGALAVTLAGGVTAAAIGPLGTADRSAELHRQIDASKPRNVILLIGDGTDESIITAARNYEKGANGRFALDDLPFVGDVTVHGLKTGPGPDYVINYVSDSAPTASAWSTGHKTVDSRVSQGPSIDDTTPGTDYETVLETYAAQGKRTGNVSTAEITDATPAAAAAHINLRACQGPTDMASCSYARKANGGKGSIAEQLVDNQIDVILGGGRNRFNQPTDAGPSVTGYAQATHGYRDIDSKQELAALTSLDDGPVLGLFAGGNMTPMYAPRVASPGGASTPTAERCTPANRGDQPTLAEMTDKAIELLDNPKGFFLQVESAMVDKQEHGSDVCGAIGDVQALDDALQVALTYQQTHPDTLIIVTADHSHSTQIVGGATDGKQTAQVLTADGDPMWLAYSTSDVGSDHTGSTVRIAAKGPQAANVTGLIDQTDIHATLLGRTPSTLDQSTRTVVVPGPTQTVTTPATTVTTTAPAPAPASAPQVSPQAPGLSVAAPKAISPRALRRGGLPVAVAVTGASSVDVELVLGRRTIARRTLSRAGNTTLKPSARTRLSGRTLQVRASASGPGGASDASQRVSLR